MSKRHTWRDVDGERIPGTWRHAFINNGGTYYLTDLFIYADGMIDCWGLVTLDEFAGKLHSGWVATELPDGATASAHHVASWKFTQPRTWLTAQMYLGEVRDEIDHLNQRPDSSGRCKAAVDVFLAQSTEDNRALLRQAYEAIPEHLRQYALGDMDHKDWPLRVLAAGPGNEVESPYDGPTTVTDEMYASALDYFTERAEAIQHYRTKVPADGPTEPRDTSIQIDEVVYPNGWPEHPGRVALRNDSPAPILLGDVVYPTVTHAYWALAVTDEQVRAEILRTDNPRAVRTVAETAALRPDWPQARTAIMAHLLRLKFDQHPELAALLIETGSTRLIYNDSTSTFWGQGGLEGRNWLGRLLELVRAELAVSATGLQL